jgi:hypothetical protein
LPLVPQGVILAHDENLQAAICTGSNRRAHSLELQPGRGVVRIPARPATAWGGLAHVPKREIVGHDEEFKAAICGASDRGSRV